MQMLEQRSVMSKVICRSWMILLLVGFVIALTGHVGASQSPTLKDILASLEKGPALGSPSAPVSIVEFSDFRCSFCKKFWADTLPKLKKSYFEKGTAQFVFRHFAILGKQSEQAALASNGY